jgi:hypothetical protein
VTRRMNLGFPRGPYRFLLRSRSRFTLLCMCRVLFQIRPCPVCNGKLPNIVTRTTFALRPPSLTRRHSPHECGNAPARIQPAKNSSQLEMGASLGFPTPDIAGYRSWTIPGL